MVFISSDISSDTINNQIDDIRQLTNTRRTCSSWVSEVVQHCPMMTIESIEYLLTAILSESANPSANMIHTCKHHFVPALCALLSQQNTPTLRVAGLLLQVVCGVKDKTTKKE